MLHLAAIADDEPEAAAPAPVLDRESLDRRAINRKAVKHWPTIRNLITDMHGRPLGDVASLNPAYDPRGVADGKRKHGGPQLKMFRGPSPFEGEDGGPGAWFDLETGASGADVISIIEHLGECDRKTATIFLRGLTDRLVEIKP
jgi:hypothetical protein